jgi:endo-1,4-beta-xylanase
MTAHITNVVTHYAGQCYAWDVVNEALNEDGTFRQSVFFQTLGSAFIPLAFRAAAAADPRAKLYYNDFNLETTPAKTAGALRIVQLLQSNKTRIDGVGFQAHLAVNHTPPRTSLAATLRRFTALGLEVAYTELDVAQTALPESAAALAQQARDYVAVVGSCLDVPRCVGVTVWQFTDKFSWVPAAFPGRGEACLFASDYSRKPAYDALVALLRGAVTGGGGGGNVTGNGTVGGGPAVGSPGPSFGAGSVVFSGAGRVAVGAVAALVGWAVLGAWILL